MNLYYIREIRFQKRKMSIFFMKKKPILDHCRKGTAVKRICDFNYHWVP